LEKGEVLGFYGGYMSGDDEHNRAHHKDIEGVSKHVAWEAIKQLGRKLGYPMDVIKKEYEYHMVLPLLASIFPLLR
jgi:hypothetical protein